uniref:Flagellar attachment zone protein 1 conserved domain-containing protein n=1 Tax=Trypanosoma congolense (strain IL3000) TaxID=1068625 RepID=G0UJL5_TRYCI|nr:conserved hypothetical protein [Trypanosoma congolense IL3000]
MQDELLEEKLVEERRLQDELLEEKLAEERELQGQLLQEKLQEERVMHERILKDLLLSKNGGSTVERSDTVLNDGGANSISPAAGISPVLHFSVIPFPGGDGRGFRESRDAAQGEMVSSGLSSEGVLQRGYDPVLRAGGDGTDLTGSSRGTKPPAVHPVTNVDDVVVASPKHTDPPGRVLPVDGKHIAAAPSVRGGYSNDCLSSVADVASNEVNKSLAAGAIVPDGGGGPSSFVAARSEDFTVVTYHHMKFCGDNWNEVLEQKRDEFFYIFDKEICSVLNLPRGSVENIKLGTDGLSVSFGVRHSNLLPKDEVDNLLATCEFPGLWKLYKPKKRPPLLAALDGRKDVSACPLSGSFSRYWNSAGVRDLSPRSFPESGVRSDADGSKLGTGATSSEGVVCNLYRVGFVGGFWSGVIDKRFSIAVDCFMRDAAAEGLSPRNVERVVSMDSGNVVFSVWVEHAPSLSQGEVCKVLDHAPFPSMWKLYDSLVNEGVVGRTTTLHRVGLVGTEWARVTNDKLVKEVFIQDVAEALNVSPEDINISECCVSDKLVVGFYVSHSPALTEVDIDDMLAHAPLSRVWGLCQSPRSQSWQTVRVKGLSVRSRSCLPSADTSQTFTLRGDSPSSRGGGPWLTTPLNRRSGARHQWHLAPLSGMGAPSSLVGQNIRGQGSEAVQNATDRSPDPSCYTTQPVTISAEMRGCKVSPRSAAGKHEHRRRKGSSPGSISSARTLLPRVDLLEVGELLALMRQRNSRDDNVYLPSLSTGLRGSGRADYGVRRYMRRK